MIQLYIQFIRQYNSHVYYYYMDMRSEKALAFEDGMSKLDIQYLDQDTGALRSNATHTYL